MGSPNSRFRALFNYPIKLKKEDTYLFLGLDYSNIHLRSENEFPFDTRDLNDFQLLDFSIGYTTPLQNDWRLGVRFQPGFSTNLVADALSIKDVVLSATVAFIKKGRIYNDKASRLILGVTYGGNSGFNFPLPFVSYYKKFRPNWSFNLGIPKTNLQYYFSQEHRLKAYAQLDGFTSNLQREVPVINGEAAASINMSLILSGLQYEYHFTKRLQFYARAAYILAIDNELRNENRDPIFTLDTKAKIYLRSGVKFKI
jgi:predicted porin